MANIRIPKIEDDLVEIIELQDTDSDEDDDPFNVDDNDEDNQQSGKLGHVQKHNQEITAAKKFAIDWHKAYRTGECTSEKLDLNQFPCSYCKFFATTVYSIKRHIRNCHKDKPISYRCPYCSYKSIQSINSIKSHILSHHTAESDVEWFRCNQCEYKAKFKGQLSTHIFYKHTDPYYKMNKCTKCPKMYQKLSHLKRHILNVHEKHCKTVKKLKCSQCDYQCTSSQQLQNHSDVFHSDFENLETLQCPKCSYSTKFKKRLHAHMVMHGNSYQCEKCPYQTKIWDNLKLHLINHKEMKDDSDLKYRCDKCPYKTYRLYSLKVHKLNHLKPEEIQYFYCYHCKFKAKRKDNLKNHVLKHFKHEEVSLGCYICEFTTVKSQLLINHIEKHSKEMSKIRNLVSV